jgi:hypothetical protein
VIAGELVGVVPPWSSAELRKYTSKLVPCSGANGRLAVYGVVVVFVGEVAYALCAIGADVSLLPSSTTWM